MEKCYTHIPKHRSSHRCIGGRHLSKAKVQYQLRGGEIDEVTRLSSPSRSSSPSLVVPLIDTELQHQTASETESERALTRRLKIGDLALPDVSRHSGFIRGVGFHRFCFYFGEDQCSDTAATAVMADDDEIEVLLAALEDGKSDWVLDSGSAYHLCRDREGCWMQKDEGLTLVEEFSEFPRETRRCCGKKKTGGLYRLEGNVQTEGATVRHGSSGISEKNGQGKQPLHRGTQSKRRGTWRIRSGTRAQGDALGYVRKSGQTRVMQPVQDVHREAQRKETKSILRHCTAKGAVTPKRVSFALDLISGGVLSSCAHKGGEMEPRQLAK
ncbi:hypothetical protein Acr_00g0064940 [Actinidia rufa]|uniref:Uncharacterized protein n=1 Tax=Actinidia rufa TaxID=165716 RepID=A0A7J0DPN8_9ERIC|nr:hypothetical protein Acr_00g0064940 [Actinidia rufa]